MYDDDYEVDKKIDLFIESAPVDTNYSGENFNNVYMEAAENYAILEYYLIQEAESDATTPADAENKPSFKQRFIGFFKHLYEIAGKAVSKVKGYLLSAKEKIANGIKAAIEKISQLASKVNPKAFGSRVVEFFSLKLDALKKFIKSIFKKQPAEEPKATNEAAEGDPVADTTVSEGKESITIKERITLTAKNVKEFLKKQGNKVLKALDWVYSAVSSYISKFIKLLKNAESKISQKIKDFVNARSYLHWLNTVARTVTVYGSKACQIVASAAKKVYSSVVSAVKKVFRKVKPSSEEETPATESARIDCEDIVIQ